ncbi:MAG: hypothetical protein MI754_11855 [Chromatiales bacterium]|nr:hypothetical protein [Chromatiales bacterium]
MKPLSICLLITYAALLSGCVSNQKISEQERIDKELGGVSRVGLVEDQAQITDIADYSFGEERVGIRFLDEETKLSAWRNIKLSERAILFAGDPDQAISYLGKALFVEPYSRDARLLIKQLEVAPERFFKSHKISLDAEREIVHKVKERDKIKRIARKYYGSENYYIALLRYNGLMREVKPNDEIRVPGGKKRKKRSRRTTVRPAAAKPAVATTQTATPSQSSEPAPNNQTVVKPAESSTEKPVANNPSATTNDQAEVATADPVAPASEQASTEIATDSQPSAEETAQLSPEDQSIDMDVSAEPDSESESVEPVYSEDTIEEPEPDAELLAFALYDEGAFSEAFLAFKEIPEPSSEALKKIEELKGRLIEAPYARGLTLYQQQKLVLAIEEFDKVLSLEPQHAQALLYKNRCQQLLEQLNKL